MTHADLVGLLESLRAYVNHAIPRHDSMRVDCVSDIDKALSALNSGEVVLVPGEPTEEMDDAARAVAFKYYEERGPIFKAVYRAMLAARGKS